MHQNIVEGCVNVYTLACNACALHASAHSVYIAYRMQPALHAACKTKLKVIILPLRRTTFENNANNWPTLVNNIDNRRSVGLLLIHCTGGLLVCC